MCASKIIHIYILLNICTLLHLRIFFQDILSAEHSPSFIVFKRRMPHSVSKCQELGDILVIFKVIEVCVREVLRTLICFKASYEWSCAKEDN